ncbi:MAG: winged helix-turn-helix domain-containing protein [Ktedonobacteraceae bacterium]
MTLHIAREQARRFLATYHFTPHDLPGVFERLGTVQYDPLNPVGRNADLVLQARVPGYRVDDWQQAAYSERLIYDAWDKQACLVLTSDWPMRAHTRELFRPYHDQEILQADPEAAAAIIASIDAQGPLSSLEFEDRTRIVNYDSWAGITRTKRILRAMWACGILLTHHRKSGRHYYDRPERIIPARYYNAVTATDIDTYYRWIIARRYQAVGLLRPNAEAAIWSACGSAVIRKRITAQLVEMGVLTPVRVEGQAALYYMPANAVQLLNAPLPEARVIFLGPLDSLLWDRKGVQQLFDFDYLWEVYKPLEQRRWGYYVLPVFYKDRFIARLDSRLTGTTWTITRWWWENPATPTTNFLDALHTSVIGFMHYLRADTVRVDDQVDPVIREHIYAAAR